MSQNFVPDCQKGFFLAIDKDEANTVFPAQPW